MPTFRHGRNTVFKIDDSGATLRDISNVLSEVTYSPETEVAETTVFDSGSKPTKQYITGFTDGTISVSGRWDATVDGYLSGILGQEATVTYEYGPEGSTTGRVKYTGECILTSYERSNTVGDTVNFTAEFQMTGTQTRTTWA